MRKWIAGILLLLCVSSACAEEKYTALPPALAVTQTTVRESLRENAYISRTYPASINAAVDTAMRQLVDSMAEANRARMPTALRSAMPVYLDVGATISRTGTKWMSFLTIARVVSEREQIAVDVQTRTFDMETGERLTLRDIIAEEGWEVLRQATNAQLSAYFPEEPNAATLAALLTREALENAAFSLGAARLMLHYRADALYPGRTSLMHVTLYYNELRPYMTAAAFEQTDNSRYKLIALTYDDGPARGCTMRLLDTLRNHAAGATFFVLGSRLPQHLEVVMRAHDAAYAVQSHTYVHEYQSLNRTLVHGWKAQVDELFMSIIGTKVRYMRPPGGAYQSHVRAEVGLPIIMWSLSSGDARPDAEIVVKTIAQRVTYSARDGAIVLMHDIKKDCAAYTQLILEKLENRGFLCVTVDELMSHHGIVMEPNVMYRSPYQVE